MWAAASPLPPARRKSARCLQSGLVQNNNMRVAAVLVLCCALAEGATKNKWKDKKCVKKHAQGLCAATNCPKKAKKCEKTATRRRLKKKRGQPGEAATAPHPCWLGELVGSWPRTPSYTTHSGAKVPLPPLSQRVFTVAFPLLQVKKCALTCGGTGAAAGSEMNTCGCTSYRNGASAGSQHLGVCQKSEMVNSVSQTVCVPGPCAGDWKPCRTMSPPPPPPPDLRPCPAHTKNTAVYHRLMTVFAGGGGNGCDDVTTGYDKALPGLKQCKAADGTDNRLSIGGDLFDWPIKDLCPGACGGRQLWADCVGANSRSDDNDNFMVAWQGATCAQIAAAPGRSAGGWCADEPMYNWMCGASCRGGEGYDECALPFGQDKFEGECPYWVAAGEYANVAACLADAPNYVSDTPNTCPADPTGDSCYYTRSALGAGSCP